MNVLSEPKIDCHLHVIDPVRFPYNPDVAYKPSGQEIGTPAQLHSLMAAYGVTHALIVQPNSGYGSDNSCMLDTIARGDRRFKGVAIIDFGATAADLRALQAQGIVGAAFNPTFHGVDYYKDCAPLVRRLADAGMFLQLQTEHDQFLHFASLLENIPVRVLIDHSGRPTVARGVNQPAFQALLKLADTGRASVKLSGYAKFSQLPYPFADTRPFVDALVDAFTLDNCMWASDWPFLRAARRVDVGTMLALFGRLVPDRDARRAIFWDTPSRVLGF